MFRSVPDRMNGQRNSITALSTIDLFAFGSTLFAVPDHTTVFAKLIDYWAFEIECSHRIFTCAFAGTLLRGAGCPQARELDQPR